MQGLVIKGPVRLIDPEEGMAPRDEVADLRHQFDDAVGLPGDPDELGLPKGQQDSRSAVVFDDPRVLRPLLRRAGGLLRFGRI